MKKSDLRGSDFCKRVFYLGADELKSRDATQAVLEPYLTCDHDPLTAISVTFLPFGIVNATFPFEERVVYASMFLLAYFDSVLGATYAFKFFTATQPVLPL